MSGLFGSKNQVNNTTPPASSLRVSSSIAGKARPIVVGQVRLALNLIDAQDFASQQTSQGGGSGGGKGGGSCVAGETLVAMPGGAKRIDALRPGDLIWSLDPDSGQRVTGRVSHVLKHAMAESSDQLLCVHVFDGDRPLFITGNHYPWIDGILRRQIKDWTIGEELIHLDGGLAPISSLRAVPTPDFTYNLVVEPHHNFFAEQLLLHNGFGGGGGKGSTQTTYTVVPVYGVCEGPILEFFQVWSGQSPQSLAALNFTGYLGGYPGLVSGYMATKHPANALPYPGLARLEATPLQLGTSANLPNINAEVVAAINGINSFNGIPSADPSLWVEDLLTNANYGVGFPPARLGDLTTYSNFCKTNLLLVSDAMTDQRALNDYLKDLMEATYSEFVFVDGALTIIPRGMQTTGGFGVAYTPPAVDYTIKIDDFLPNTNATGTSSASTALSNDPVIWTTKRRSDLVNQITVNCNDRQHSYNPNPQIAHDLAAIEDFGLRAGNPKQYSFFTDAFAALASAHYQLEYAQIDKTCSFTLGMKYARVMPMSILAGIPLPAGVGTTTVRVVEITQNQDFSFSITAEEYPIGGIAPQQYNSENPNPNAPGINSDPGPVAPPLIFEPSVELLQSMTPQIWLGACGSNPAIYGGCNVYVATSQEGPYGFAGTISGPTRMGATVADFPAGSDPDKVDTLSVSLAESGTQLASGTVFDADNAATLCLVRGTAGDEYVSYETATLTGASTYALGTYLRRGLYGSAIVDHPAGAAFARLDGNLLELDYPVTQIGQLLWFKFLAFNQFGGGLQELGDDEVAAYSYRVTGAGFAALLPAVTGLTAAYIGGLTQLAWNPVNDPRPVQYEIRQGTAPLNAVFVGRTPNTNFQLQGGNGTYWVAAYSNPVPGVVVYSENWASLQIAGATLVRNVAAAIDEAARHWNGTISGALAVAGGDLVTAGSGNFLGVANDLGESDFLFEGAAASSGTYTSAVTIDTGRAAASYVTMTFMAQGVAANANFLGVLDFLGQGDTIGYAYSANIAATPMVGLSSDGVRWTWQQWQPGQYNSQYFSAALLLESTDAETQAIATDFAWEIDMPDRVDVYQNVAIPSGGLALSFTPTGTTTPVPFNGGPGGTPNTPGLPVVDVGWQNQAGDQLAITGVTLAGCTISITNGGVGVARTAQLIEAQGY